MKILVLLLASGAAVAGDWTYNLLGVVDESSTTGFWNIYLNDSTHAVEVPGLHGNGYYCADQSFHCVDSDVFRFAVPKVATLSIGQTWKLRGMSYATLGRKSIALLGVELDVWIIESSKGAAPYGRYFYSNARGLVAFTLLQDTSFFEGEFYMLNSEYGFGAPTAE